MRASLLIAVCLGLGCSESNGTFSEPRPPDGGACVVTPTELDFGEVDLGKVTRIGVTVINVGSRHNVVVEPMAAPFFLEQLGEVSLSGQSTTTFPITFQPQDALLHLGEFRLTDRDAEGPACNVSVPLRGLGAGGIIASPTLLDFGFLDVGQERTLELRLENPRRDEVSLNIFVEDQLNAPFTFSAPDPTVMPPRSSMVLSVTARPGGLANTGRLVISPSRGPQLVVPLHFTIGVPVAELSPLAALPLVGFSPGSQPPSFADRVLRLRNVGTTGIFNEAFLRLEGTPPFTVEALDGGFADELTVTGEPLLVRGLSPGQFSVVTLHLEPRSPGPRLYRITFHTNEPADHVVMLQTVVEVLPACSLQVSPTGDLHLAQTPDGGASGTVTFTNTGLETCVIDDLRLITGGNALYSLVGNEPSQLVVPADAGSAVTIAGLRGSAFNSVATLTFHVFGPNSVREQRAIFTTP